MQDKLKLVMQARKLQKQLAKQVIEVSAGDGAVVVKITAEQKIKKIMIDPDQVDLEDISQLETWLETAIKEAIVKSQEVAAEKMKPIMGDLSKLGF